MEDPKSLQLLGAAGSTSNNQSKGPSVPTGLSLKSPLDLETLRPEEPVSPPVISANNKESSGSISGPESPTPDVGGSIQAALSALQAGQISLNQLSMQLMALGKYHFFILSCI